MAFDRTSVEQKGMTEAQTRDGRLVTNIHVLDEDADITPRIIGTLDGKEVRWYMGGTPENGNMKLDLFEL